MTKKLDPKDQYNSSLHTLIPGGIAYDKKAYKEIWEYIKKHLWKHMNKDWVKKAVFVLDDPLQEYGNDKGIFKQVLRNFLPTVKKALKIDKQHPLKNQLSITIPMDRLIQQQFNLYNHIVKTSWLLTEVLQQKWSENSKKSTTKSLVVDKVPSNRKTIIANILIFMILEEELQK